MGCFHSQIPLIDGQAAFLTTTVFQGGPASLHPPLAGQATDCLQMKASTGAPTSQMKSLTGADGSQSARDNRS